MSVNNIIENLVQLFESTDIKISNIKPSEWTEQHRIMTSAESPFPGKYSYSISPYLREIVDCMMPDHPARVISVMKGAQIGFTTGVIEPAIGWIISEQPCNVLFLTGHSDLTEEAIARLDGMIDGCGIRHLIKPTALRARRSKTGDTNKKKEFAGGSLVSGSAGNHKLLRQRSIKTIFIDDFDAAKSDTKESGSTRKMIEQRSAAYYDQMKIYYISTPETKPSNIEDSFLLGDQRRYHIPCPCCGEFISLHWEIELEGQEKEMAGMTWKLDESNRLIAESVGYRCQKCGDVFTDANKQELLQYGEWIPTAIPSRDGYYSYHISALYAPVGMYDWEHYVRDYLESNPPEAKRNEKLHQTFVNLCLGQSYEPKGETIAATELQKNIRNYQVASIPERLSEQDGNGKIVLLTLGADLNGRLDDARLDYEIVAYSENGASYSIDHGSIGTFIPREGYNGPDRERWTYEHGMNRSVWPELEKILSTTFETDTGRKMKIFISGIDCGYQTVYAYQYIDSSNNYVIGLKGKDMDKSTQIGIDAKTFRLSKEKSNLYLVESNIVKDRLAENINLTWNPKFADIQPSGFMNFPLPSNGKYLFTNYFSHFEAEHKVLDSDKTFRWKKKNDVVQNHLFDCRLYADVCRDILVSLVCKEFKIYNGSWNDYVNLILRKRV